MATYEEIRAYVYQQYGWKPKDCWIAHCKEMAGLPVSRSPRRTSDVRQVPCPPNKREAIFDAFRYFGMM